MIEKIKYFISGGTNPYENLAIEKYLLDNVEDGTYILYLWQNENTVVIGKNQNPWAECDYNTLAADGGRVARRLSGGGAVYHDSGNLNFTFISKEDDMSIEKNLSVIKRACEKANIETEISGRNDILADGKKFSGNAFYHGKGKSYHHGTILINADTDKMTRYLTPNDKKLSAKGVKSVKSRVVNLSELAFDITIDKMKDYMLTSFAQEFNLPLCEIEKIDEKSIKTDMAKFSSWDFIFGSTIPFTLKADSYFSWGSASLLLEIADGVIKTAKLYTDAMDFSVAEALENTLVSIKFQEDDIKKALTKSLSPTISSDILSLIFDDGK